MYMCTSCLLVEKRIVTCTRVKRSAETRGNAREIDGFPRYFYSGFSRNLAIHRPETVQFRGVFSTEWMETISACKVLMLVVCGVARCSAFFLLRDLAWCCQILVASHSRRPVVRTLLLTLPQEPQAVARA